MGPHGRNDDEEQQALSGDAQGNKSTRHQVHAIVNLVELHQTKQLDPLDNFAETTNAQKPKHTVELLTVAA